MKSFVQTALHYGLQLRGCEGNVGQRDIAQREVVQRVRFGERKRVERGREIAEGKRRGGIGVLEEERRRRVHDAHRFGAAPLCREVLEQASRPNGRTQRALLRVPAIQRLAPHFGFAGIGELEGARGDRGGGDGGEDGGVVERGEVGGPLRVTEVVSGIGSRIEEGSGVEKRRVGVERRLVHAEERVGCVHRDMARRGERRFVVYEERGGGEVMTFLKQRKQSVPDIDAAGKAERCRLAVVADEKS